METERELLKRLAALPDEALQESVRQVAQAMGVDPNLAAGYTGNPDALRRAALGLSGDDICAIRRRLGDETMQKLCETVKAKLGDV